jgi:aldose 1-epimerase
MPAVLGWHPCFRKPLQADLEFASMYARDHEYIAVPDLVAPKPRPWDDCFIDPIEPLRLHYPGLTLTLFSDCDHWVVYDEPDDVTCVEPQSGPPDAFTIGGAERLEPGELLQRRFSLRWGR